MRLTIEVIGLPGLSEALGGREIQLDLPDKTTTAREVLDKLVQRFGPAARRVLHDRRGSLNPMIQIALNGKAFIPSHRLDTPLSDGDTLTFILLMAGGAES